MSDDWCDKMEALKLGEDDSGGGDGGGDGNAEEATTAAARDLPWDEPPKPMFSGTGAGVRKGKGVKRKSDENDIVKEIDEQVHFFDGEPPRKMDDRWLRLEPGEEMSALSAVDSLELEGVPAIIRVGKMGDPNWHPEHLYRCTVTWEEIKGVADSDRVMVCRELACTDFLKKYAETGREPPPFKTPDELFISPSIYDRVSELAEVEVKFKVKNESGVDKDTGTPYNYQVECSIGEDVFTGKHVREKYAKIGAACQAYKFLTGNEFPRSSYFVGKDCYSDYLYTFSAPGAY